MQIPINVCYIKFGMHSGYSLCTNYIMWWYSSGSTLSYVASCFVKTPNHYITQCWLIIDKACFLLTELNFTETALDITNYKQLKNYIFENIDASPRVNGLAVCAIRNSLFGHVDQIARWNNEMVEILLLDRLDYQSRPVYSMPWISTTMIIYMSWLWRHSWM